jgi:hypothetical protein
MVDTGNYLRSDSNNSTHLDVTKDNFIKLYVENGGKPDEALMQAMISKKIGSYVKIGEKMYCVVSL